MFNENLVKLRNTNALTQEEMAKEMNVSRSVIAKWESGRGLPNTKNLLVLSKMFSISMEQLLE